MGAAELALWTGVGHALLTHRYFVRECFLHGLAEANFFYDSFTFYFEFNF